MIIIIPIFLVIFIYTIFQLFRLLGRRDGAGQRFALGFMGSILTFILIGIVGSQVSPGATEAERAASATRRAAEKAEQEAAAEKQRRVEACTDENMFRATAKEAVLDHLKAPATAEFPAYSQVTIARVSADSCRYIVRSYVDAQNSFGAQVRSDWLVDIEYLPETDKYMANTVAIQPR